MYKLSSNLKPWLHALQAGLSLVSKLSQICLVDHCLSISTIHYCSNYTSICSDTAIVREEKRLFRSLVTEPIHRPKSANPSSKQRSGLKRGFWNLHNI